MHVILGNEGFHERAYTMKSPGIPPLMTEIVQTGISAFEGVVFTQHTACPVCGGSLIGYDIKKKQFAHLVTEHTERTVFVSVKRFYCRDCHRVCYADEPFYPNSRIGSVVIDLCLALSMTMPPNRVSAYLAVMGVRVNRMSCRLYIRNSRHPPVRDSARSLEANAMFGIHLPRSILALSVLALEVDEGNQIREKDILQACGFPSRQVNIENRIANHEPDHSPGH